MYVSDYYMHMAVDWVSKTCTVRFVCIIHHTTNQQTKAYSQRQLYKAYGTW